MTHKAQETERMPKYSSNVAWSEQDAAYIAVSPEFPRLSGLGDTPEEAVRQLQVAIDLAVETHEKEGWPLPEPNLIGEYSGQFRLRIPKSLHQALTLRAQAEGVSLNTLAVTFLANGFGRTVAQLQSAKEVRDVLHEFQAEAQQFRLVAAVMMNFQGASSQTVAAENFQDPTLKALYAAQHSPVTRAADSHLAVLEKTH